MNQDNSGYRPLLSSPSLQGGACEHPVVSMFCPVSSIRGFFCHGPMVRVTGGWAACPDDNSLWIHGCCAAVLGGVRNPIYSTLLGQP
jgi:hypothetical protein